MLAFALALCAWPACGPAPTDDPRPTVAVSVLPQAWLVGQLAGDLVQVAVMIPPGASEATYEPTMNQMRAVQRARLYVKVGHPRLPFEAAWLDDLLRDAPGVEVLSGFAGVQMADDDPHPWTSPAAMAVAADNAAAALARLLPGHADELTARHAALRDLLAALDSELAATLAPLTGRRFFVFHPAWGYFARQYGLRQVSIEHDHKEPSADELAHLIELARSEGATMIVVQPHFSTQAAATVAAALDARLVEADPLARDWDRNLRRFAALLVEGL